MVRIEHNFYDIIELIILSKTLTCIWRSKSISGLCQTSARYLWWQFVGFLRKKLVQNKHNIKNIQKSQSEA